MRRRSPLALVVAFLAACGNVVGLPDPGPAPAVIESVLVAGEPAGTFRVALADRLGTVSAPKPASGIALRLRSATAAAPLAAVPDSAGYFRAPIPIAPGGRYRLEGTAGGAAVLAETAVPGPLVLVEPGSDTVRLPLGRIQTIRIAWRAAGASALAVSGGYFSSGATRTSRPAELLFVGPPDHAAETTVELWALNADLDRYLSSGSPPAGNVHGAVGVVGGAASTRLILEWR